MIGVIVVTHGPMGRALVRTAEMIVGGQENVHGIALNPSSNLEDLLAEVERVARVADTGEGVLVLVDMFGGTPANAVAANLRSHEYECLCGVNLPMMLEALLMRPQMPLTQLATHVEQMACQSVVNLRTALARAIPPAADKGQS